MFIAVGATLLPLLSFMFLLKSDPLDTEPCNGN
jgi:hypothetical protein